MHRVICVALLAACTTTSAPAPVPPPAAGPACTTVARHVMRIGPVEKWIVEAREDEILPVDDATDRQGLERLFELACRENWEIAQRRCVVAQPTWSAVERECRAEKVWWYTPT